MVWYGFGFSGFGQLGEELNRYLPEPVRIPEARGEGKHICKVTPSWSYTVLLTDDGSLSLSGFIDGSSQQYLHLHGLGCLDALPADRYLVVLFQDSVKCWDTRSLGSHGIQAEPMWGMDLPSGHSPAFPLVANGYVLHQPPFFRELPSRLQARKLVLGNEHVVMLTADSMVLAWGAGRHGQLGHGDLEDVLEPRIVDALHGVAMSDVAAGGWHSASISDGGDIYCWGWNESGQLGLPSKALAKESGSAEVSASGSEAEVSEFISIQSFPALIDLPQESEASKISCGSRHTAAVTRCGELFTWGWGKYGQLGHGDAKSLDHPKRVEYFIQNKLCVENVTCRYWNTYVLCCKEK
ncbi:RCC1 domain-containing protein 1 [Spea bombifrons]|uniref:RCC1 domain-containing protein 1 n=1 Tax=Spea bombifrons TaxID=233779 RepID=UPI00234AD866|nr:RCC1 domain-containing protein 1 [Spea bombifrons]